MFESTNVIIMVDVLTRTVVPIVTVAIVAIFLQLVVLICAAPSSSRDTSRRARTPRVALLLLAAGLAVGMPTAEAQTQASDEIPQVEARYARVFGSDTVEVMMARLSPDGRWIAYSSYKGGETTAGLWMVSTDGGDPIQLTDGTWDIQVDWFPTSDRIVFRSGEEGIVMTLPIDPANGQPSGPVQRITLESAASPMVSPDGEWISYRRFEGEGTELQMALKVIPARGGSARTLVQLPGRPYFRSWSLDSGHLVYTWRGPETEGPWPDLWLISVGGGESTRVTGDPVEQLALARPYAVYKGNATNDAGDPLYVVSSLDQASRFQVSLPRNVQELSHATRVTPDGKRVVAVVSNTVSPLRVLPVAGGTARQLGDARTNDMPVGWTPDGEHVVFTTQLDGRVAVMAAAVDEDAAAELAVIPGLRMGAYRRPVLLSEDGHYLAFVKPVLDRDISELVIARTTDGELRTASESLTDFGYFGLSGPGGLPTTGDEFLYLEKHGDTVEFRAASFDRPSRLLRTFSQIVGRRVAGVFGDRVVWTEQSGDSTAIYIAEGPDGQPRQLAMVNASFEGLVWSPDGRWIAGGGYLADQEETRVSIFLMGFNEDGEVTSGPRFLDTQIGVGWGIRWLPNSQSFTIFAQSLPSWGTDVWLFSLREGESPIAITRDETAEFWYYSLSPDGRYIAYPGAVPRGSSIWIADLGD